MTYLRLKIGHALLTAGLFCLSILLSGCSPAPESPGNQEEPTSYLSVTVGNDFLLALDASRHLTLQNVTGTFTPLPDTTFSVIRTKGNSVLAIAEDGSAYLWENGMFSGNVPGPLDEKIFDNTSPLPFGGPVADGALGEAHAVFLLENGTVFTVGRNTEHQLGFTGDVAVYNTPQKVEELGKVRSVAAGGRHSAAVTENGEIYLWGDLSAPALENAYSPSLLAYPQQVAAEEPMVEIQSGFSFDIALSESGTLYGRGRNEFYQCGTQEAVYLYDFTKIPLPEKVIAYSVGDRSVLAATESGAVYAWGYNGDGQLGLPAAKAVAPTQLALTEITAISAGGPVSCFETAAGKTFVSGRIPAFLSKESVSILEESSFVSKEPGNIKELVSGYAMSAFLDEHNQLFTWGTSWRGSLGAYHGYTIQKPTYVYVDGQEIAALDSCYGVMTVLTTKGAIYNWGVNIKNRLGLGHSLDLYLPEQVELPAPADAFFAGTNATFARLQDGRWFVWGDNQYGSLLTGDTLPQDSPKEIHFPFSVKGIASHANHTLLLDESGVVYQYGDPVTGELSGYQKVSGIEQAAVQVAVTSGGCYVLTENGTLYAWGDNSDGHLGLPEARIYESPTQVPVKEKILTFSVSPVFGLALARSEDGHILTWGYDVLRLSGEEILPIPTPIENLSDIIQVIAGDLSSYGVTSSGQVYTWGGVINSPDGEPLRTPVCMSNMIYS